MVGFPTCGKNALDLIFSDLSGETKLDVPLGSSDHNSIVAVFKTEHEISAAPVRAALYHWGDAPWEHIKAALKVALRDWDARSYGSVDQAEIALSEILQSITDRYVKRSVPPTRRPLPWWDVSCRKAFKQKQKAFLSRHSHPGRYSKAKKRCSVTQKRAFAAYQKKVKDRLAECSKSDREFWNLAKEI